MKRLIVSACLGALPFVAFGQDSDGASAPNPFSLQLSGDHEFLYSEPVGAESWATGYDGEMKTPRFRSEGGVEIKEGQIDLVSKWEIESSNTGNRVRNLENYVSWNPDAFKLAFGYQVYSWGVADGKNPTDNLNPRDYTTLEGAKVHKLPVLSASSVWYPTDELSIETVFVPHTDDSVFPLDYAQILSGYGYSVSSDAIRNIPRNFVTGGKVNYRSQAVDLSVSYLYDFDPMLTPVIGDDLTSITLVRKRVQRFGADAKTTIDRYGLWAEAAYTVTGNEDSSDYSERLSKLDYTLGFDFNYGPNDDYYVNFQYTGTVIPGYDSSANTFSTSDIRYAQKSFVGFLGGEQERVLQGVTWNAHWNLANETVVPSFTGSYTVPFGYDDSSKTRYGELLLKPEIDVMPVDSFHITVGAILAYAWVRESGNAVTLDTTSDPLGIYTPQNHLFVNVSYKWNYQLNK